jgi:hypothetical protein
MWKIHIQFQEGFKFEIFMYVPNNGPKLIIVQLFEMFVIRSRSKFFEVYQNPITTSPFFIFYI